MKVARLLPVPRHAQQRPVRRRGGGRGPAQRAAGRTAAAPLRRRRAPRGRPTTARSRWPSSCCSSSTSAPHDLYRVDGPVNLRAAEAVLDLVDRPDLKYPPFQPGLPRRARPARDLFAAIRRSDILLHHPFESFTPVIDFLEQAADDPQRARDQADALPHRHRLARSSSALVARPRDGKEVTVGGRAEGALRRGGQHQLGDAAGGGRRARRLRRGRLQDPRQDDAGGAARGRRLRRYVHLGTGNYHPRTARLYTDFGLLHRRRGDLRRRARGVPAADRPRPGARAAAACCSRPSRCTRTLLARDRARGRRTRAPAGRRASSPR